MVFASMKKVHITFYNTVVALICSLFWLTKDEHRIENKLADVLDGPLVKTVKVHNQPRRIKNARPIASGSNKKLRKILVDMKKEKYLLVQQLYKTASENELIRKRLANLENSRDSNATVAATTDNVKFIEKLDEFMEKFSQITRTNDVKIDSKTGGDGKYNEEFDKKLEKLQMTVDALLADNESIVRLNSNANRELSDLKSRLDVFERNGHVKTAPDNDYNSLKSDLDQIKNDMQSLKGSISKNNNCSNGDAEQLTRKYNKLKMRVDFIEQNVAHNSTSIYRTQQSLQKAVNVMTVTNQRNAYSPQQPMYVDRRLREPAVYSDPPQDVYAVPEPPVISIRPREVISTRPVTSTCTPPLAPMTPRPHSPPPPPPPPSQPPAETPKAYERIAITAEALNAVALKKPDGKPNKIKIRNDIVIVKRQPKNPR